MYLMQLCDVMTVCNIYIVVARAIMAVMLESLNTGLQDICITVAYVFTLAAYSIFSRSTEVPTCTLKPHIRSTYVPVFPRVTCIR